MRGRPGLRTFLRRASSERALLAGALLLVALVTPWSVGVRALHWPQVFGWRSPLSLVAIAATAVVYVRSARRYAAVSAVIAGLALLAWAGWVGAQLLTTSFRHSGFAFLPIDLLGEGWYIAVLAFAVTIDGLAVQASADVRPAGPKDVWPFAIVPGMGMVRLHYAVRGRLWFLGVALCVFLLQSSAVGVEELQYYASLGSLPPGRPRTGALVPAALVILVWLLSFWDTWRRLRIEKTADQAIMAAGGDRDAPRV